MEDQNPSLPDVTGRLLALHDMNLRQLRAEYEGVMGEPTRSRNAQWLRRKLAWRIQELAEGGLTPRTLARVDAVLDWCDREKRHPIGASRTRALPPKPGATTRRTVKGTVPTQPRDPRLPPVGATVTRHWSGEDHMVTVEARGFTYAGERYRSLSAVATAITGCKRNGFRFFGLDADPAKEAS